jgi:hypothetical protein
LTEELPGNQCFWAEKFDLSALSYPQFLAFFFDRPIVVDGKEQYDLFRSGIDYFIASNPTTVVAHLQTMCRTFSELTKVYSHEQLDQGLWAVFGAAISCEQFLFDPEVDLGLRIDCIECMYLPFRDVVAHSTVDIMESFYWMWWDMILHTFWEMADEYECDFSALSDDGKRVVEAMYQTLLMILALNHRGCQWSALHGLGHLHHPLGWLAVQSYLNVHRNELTDEDVQWVENCGNGSIA